MVLIIKKLESEIYLPGINYCFLLLAILNNRLAK